MYFSAHFHGQVCKSGGPDSAVGPLKWVLTSRHGWATTLPISAPTAQDPMTADLPDNAVELRSLVTSHGTLELSLHEVPIPVPSANEVLVRLEASPINPSDVGLLLAGADMTTAHVAGTPERPVITAPLTEDRLRALSARVDSSLAVG